MHDALFSVETNTLIRIFLLAFMGFLVSMLITPVYTTLAYRWRWWVKPGAVPAGDDAALIMELHGEKHTRLIPTMAGAVFVVATCLVTVIFNFSREGTWLPLAAFVGAGIVGLLDDVTTIRSRGGAVVRFRGTIRLLLTSIVALIGGLFFYGKLDVSSIAVPLAGTNWELGWLIVPLFVLVVVATANAVNVTDGEDGLAGGLAVAAFGVYAIIAMLEGRFAVAGFCLTVVGTLLSYTWFNIHPARFFMGDVGSFALGTALGVVAMITDTVLLLPVIGLVFAAEGASSIVQALFKKVSGGKKLFKIAPLHLHFEASGWPETKVVMRFWIIGQVSGVLGLIIFLLGYV